MRSLNEEKNTNRSYQRQILSKEKELKRLYKMFSELSERIDRNLPDSSLLKSKINDFISNYNKKIFSLTSQISEISRRNNEKLKNWEKLHESLRNSKQKMHSLENAIRSQRIGFKNSMEKKDLALMKANRLSTSTPFSLTP